MITFEIVGSPPASFMFASAFQKAEANRILNTDDVTNSANKCGNHHSNIFIPGQTKFSLGTDTAAVGAAVPAAASAAAFVDTTVKTVAKTEAAAEAEAGAASPTAVASVPEKIIGLILTQ